MAGPMKWFVIVALASCTGTDVELHVQWTEWNGEVTGLSIDGDALPPNTDRVIEQSFDDYPDAVLHFRHPIARVTIDGVESEKALDLPYCDEATRHAVIRYSVHRNFGGSDDGLYLGFEESECDGVTRVPRSY